VSVLRKAKKMKKKTLFTSKLDIYLRKKPDKCYIWSVALYGSETWALPKVDQKCLRVLRCSAGEGCRRAVGPII
jgi:hypothetical protein